MLHRLLQNWFQNKRAKERKQATKASPLGGKSVPQSNISPPTAGSATKFEVHIHQNSPYSTVPPTALTPPVVQPVAPFMPLPNTPNSSSITSPGGFYHHYHGGNSQPHMRALSAIYSPPPVPNLFSSPSYATPSVNSGVYHSPPIPFYPQPTPPPSVITWPTMQHWQQAVLPAPATVLPKICVSGSNIPATAIVSPSASVPKVTPPPPDPVSKSGPPVQPSVKLPSFSELLP